MGIYSALSESAPLWLNFQTLVPDLPLSNKENAASNSAKLMDPETASRRLVELISDVKKPVIFAGHSLGVNIALYTLSQYGVAVDAAMLISGRYKTPTGDDYLERCYRRELKPFVIRGNIRGPFIAVHSRDDSVVTPAETNLTNIATTFGAKPILVDGHGHFDKPQDTSILINLLRTELLPYILSS